MYYSEYYISDKFAILVHEKYEISKHRESVLKDFVHPCIMCVCACSVVSTSFVTPWTIATAPPPTRLLCPWNFPDKNYWSRLPYPPPGDLLNPGIKPGSHSGSCINKYILYHWATWEAHVCRSDNFAQRESHHWARCWRCLYQNPSSHCSWGSWGMNARVVCLSLLQ